MKGFLVLLVLSAAGLAGVLYWRQSLRAPRAPIAAATGEPAKDGKERRRKKRRGARRIARNDVFVASAPPGEAPMGEAPSPVFAPHAEESVPLAPGGSSVTEAPGSDPFAAAASSPARAPSPTARSPVVDEPEPIKLRPADLKIVWQGEDLSRPETMRLDLSNDAAGHDLTEAEIDARFRTKEDAVLGCVARARPDEYTFIPGRITVRFRIQRTGTVKGVQVEAPVILHKGGLTGCIRGVMNNLRFPASNASQVVTFPFSLM